MKKILIVAMALMAMTGCGVSNQVAAPTLSHQTSASANGLFSSFKEANYQEASYKQLGSFWSREGCAAEDGNKFKVSGKTSANPPSNFTEGWSVTISNEGDYNYIVSGKFFLTRSAGERYVEKLGAGTDETVTVYLTVKKASSTMNRVEIDAVKRADGQIITL